MAIKMWEWVFYFNRGFKVITLSQDSLILLKFSLYFAVVLINCHLLSDKLILSIQLCWIKQRLTMTVQLNSILGDGTAISVMID